MSEDAQQQGCGGLDGFQAVGICAVMSTHTRVVLWVALVASGKAWRRGNKGSVIEMVLVVYWEPASQPWDDAACFGAQLITSRVPPSRALCWSLDRPSPPHPSPKSHHP